MNKRARETVDKQENMGNPGKKFKENKPLPKPNVSFECNQSILESHKNVANQQSLNRTISKKDLKSKTYEKIATFRSKEDIIIGKRTKQL